MKKEGERGRKNQKGIEEEGEVEGRREGVGR